MKDTYIYKFKVRKSIHHYIIQIYQPTRCNNFSSLLLDVYVQLNMFRASSRLKHVELYINLRSCCIWLVDIFELKDINIYIPMSISATQHFKI